MSVFDVDKSSLLADVLRRHGVPVHYRTGWYAVSCPIKNAHSNGDKHKSASVSIGKGYLKCHGCGFVGDGFDIMQELEGMDAKEVRDIFGQEQPSGEPAGDSFSFDR